jgi:hypothetical protein
MRVALKIINSSYIVFWMLLNTYANLILHFIVSFTLFSIGKKGSVWLKYIQWASDYPISRNLEFICNWQKIQKEIKVFIMMFENEFVMYICLFTCPVLAVLSVVIPHTGPVTVNDGWICDHITLYSKCFSCHSSASP